MIIKKKEVVTQEVSTVIGIKCDICKKTFDSKYNEDQMEIQEFIRISTRGGYNSVFGDDFDIRLDICQHCFKEKLGEFVRVE